MKKNSYIILALAGMLSMNSCNDDEFLPGNPKSKQRMQMLFLVTVFRSRLKPRMWMCLFLR